MVQPYVFMTDSDSDLPFEFADERNIPVVKMPYALDGKEYFDDNGRLGVEAQKEFFNKMRAGSTPSTSCLSKMNYLEYFEPYLKEGKDILFLSFSSQMSATLQFVQEARQELLEQYPQRRMEVVDTLSISAPMALLVLAAHDLYQQGASIDEVKNWVLENRFHSHAFFTVDDLKYLRRGGRLSATSAFFGTVLDIKPIICMSKAGKLEATEKTQGRKKALRILVDRTAENIEHPEEQVLCILHADCEDEALKLKEMILSRIPNLKGIRIQMIGPVIGAHCGPGTLASVFMGKERTR